MQNNPKKCLWYEKLSSVVSMQINWRNKIDLISQYTLIIWKKNQELLKKLVNESFFFIINYFYTRVRYEVQLDMLFISY